MVSGVLIAFGAIVILTDCIFSNHETRTIMSDDFLRKQTQIQHQNYPHTQHVRPGEADAHTRQVINNELDRLRAEQERKWREQQR